MKITAKDAEPQLAALRRLIGQHGIKKVDIVGSVATKGESEKDVDIAVGVSAGALNLSMEQILNSDDTWMEIESPDDLDPPATALAVEQVRLMLASVMGALRAAGGQKMTRNREIIGGAYPVGSRFIPTDVFLYAFDEEEPG